MLSVILEQERHTALGPPSGRILSLTPPLRPAPCSGRPEMIASMIILPRREPPLARLASIAAQRLGNGMRLGSARILLRQASVIGERLLDARARRAILGDRRFRANPNPSPDAKCTGVAKSSIFSHGHYRSPDKAAKYPLGSRSTASQINLRPHPIGAQFRRAVSLPSCPAAGRPWSGTGVVRRGMRHRRLQPDPHPQIAHGVGAVAPKRPNRPQMPLDRAKKRLESDFKFNGKSEISSNKTRFRQTARMKR